jgi:hypothetical protein
MTFPSLGCLLVEAHYVSLLDRNKIRTISGSNFL